LRYANADIIPQRLLHCIQAAKHIFVRGWNGMK